MIAWATASAAGRLTAQRRITGEESNFLRQHAQGAYKVTLPAPSNFFIAGWKPGITDSAYADRAEMTQDIARIVRAEVHALINEGATYIQLDAPYYCVFFEEEGRERLRACDIDPDQALASMMAADNGAWRSNVP